MSKQVTAYNAVNNSTVSRTSASKYGEFSRSAWGGENARACGGDYHEGSPAERQQTPGRESGGLTVSGESPSGEGSPHLELCAGIEDFHP